jgi:hypothetical protein
MTIKQLHITVHAKRRRREKNMKEWKKIEKKITRDLWMVRQARTRRRKLISF